MKTLTDAHNWHIFYWLFDMITVHVSPLSTCPFHLLLIRWLVDILLLSICYHPEGIFSAGIMQGVQTSPRYPSMCCNVNMYWPGVIYRAEPVVVRIRLSNVLRMKHSSTLLPEQSLNDVIPRTSYNWAGSSTHLQQPPSRTLFQVDFILYSVPDYKFRRL